jgi:hypothetical protein
MSKTLEVCSMPKNQIQERRWIILGEDGRFVSLGQATDPQNEEIQEAETALAAQGLSGWLAVLAGSPYENSAPDLLEVRPLAKPTRTFDEARSAFLAKLKTRKL